jgi:putative endonuclease
MNQSQQPEWFVYMVRADDQTLYAGITTNLERRLKQHKSGKGGAKYFRGRAAVEYVYTESGHSHSSAAMREAQIKKLSKRQKELLL